MIEKKKLSEKAKYLVQSQCEISDFHAKSYQDVYDPITNKNGCISLLWSENNLMSDLLIPKLHSIQLNPQNIITKYHPVGGVAKFRSSIANLLSTRIFKSNFDRVNPNNIRVAAGTSAILEALFFSICNQNDILISPSPMYSGFSSDADIILTVKILSAPMEVYDNENPAERIKSFKLDLSTFEKIYQENPQKVKGVILCNPNNPTGHTFSESELHSVVQWCRDKDIHLIVDEIYTFSVFNDGKPKFTSIYDICNGKLDNFVHIVNGFSKDFGLGGLRAGYIYSENKDILSVLDYFQHQLCSTMVQSLISNNLWITCTNGCKKFMDINFLKLPF
eukprot:gene5892-7337_t